MSDIIEELRENLVANSDEELQKRNQYFFKEYIRGYGMKSATLTAICKEHFKKVKEKSKSEILDLWETAAFSSWKNILHSQYS